MYSLMMEPVYGSKSVEFNVFKNKFIIIIN